MFYYLFSFRARGESIRLFELAKKEGVAVALISTPRCISIGCGLTVKVAKENFEKLNEIYKCGCFRTFLGLFYYEEISPVLSKNKIERVCG